MGNKALSYTALTIAIIGAVNWGLVGFFNFNLVSFIFGSMTWITRIVYALVGICGLYLLTFFGRSEAGAEDSR
ncbi:MAG: DUF378 domain-containing protein [Hungatella sp.]|jgi:uncharacterized membrane protein YuzA (DUF378 family)|uniref:DUF378 domain-containing protein n=1 Tax=Lacrimispora sp. BS-2 TaxID=3151850 RepID=A0AAU7PN01_9FIRM|nr:DUF378 domain-containing protein [Lacrimispora sp.]MDR0923097.1 DUF378 domain-containing protein [Hungatella sp.]MDR1547870.1 DUF378 domain-containing protein [Hungatella sp.]MDR1772560.1 DUF378 domain-containing protein [Hungatella sp.]MDR2024644.1 DUF378 domain-containing protein [Hungatella sp.]